MYITSTCVYTCTCIYTCTCMYITSTYMYMYNIVHVNTIGHILTIVHIRCTCIKNDSTVIVYYSIHVYYVSINNTVTTKLHIISIVSSFCKYY